MVTKNILSPCPHGDVKNFNHHTLVVTKNTSITMLRWQLKLFWLLPACGDQKPFSRHPITMPMWWLKTFQSPQCLSPPPIPPFVFPSSLPPPNGNWNLFHSPSCVILSLKNGVTDGNPLGTWMEHVAKRWKIENNPSLFGVKFDAIL